MPTTSFQGREVYELSRDGAAARIAPQHGARLLDWSVGGREVIRWPARADWSQPNKIRGGNPILFPFIARHYVDGTLGRWRDADGVARDLPMHGFARDAAFSVAEAGEDFLRMRLEATEATRAFYPYEFRFEVAYRLLDGARLEVELATTNTGGRPLPYYAGHHFYFAIDHARRADWMLELPFARSVIMSPEGTPQQAGVPAAASLDQPELVDRIHLAPAATRFALRNRADGRAILFDLAPRETVPWYAVTTWTQAADSDFYCVEPWLGLPNAIHHGQGLRRLAPGATERAVCALQYRNA